MMNWKCPCCGTKKRYIEDALPVICECGSVCGDCIKKVRSGWVCDNAKLCEFCSDDIADQTIHGADVHRVCKQCKENHDDEKGWWA